MTPREGIGQIPDYEKKLSILIKRQNGCCAIAAAHGEFAEPTELHHARIINDKWSRMKFPLFIHSLVNLMAVSREWRIRRGGFGHWPERQVAWFEQRMRSNKDLLARWSTGKARLTKDANRRMQDQLRVASSDREAKEARR